VISAYHVIRIEEILRVGQSACPAIAARFRQMVATRLPERTGTNMAEQANLKQYNGSQRGSQSVWQELGVNGCNPQIFALIGCYAEYIGKYSQRSWQQLPIVSSCSSLILELWTIGCPKKFLFKIYFLLPYHLRN
jgi:hypothetical protein